MRRTTRTKAFDSCYEEDCSLFHRVQMGSVATKGVDSGRSFPGISWPRHESDDSSSLMQRLRIRGALPPLPVSVHSLVVHSKQVQLYRMHLILQTENTVASGNIRKLHGTWADTSTVLLCITPQPLSFLEAMFRRTFQLLSLSSCYNCPTRLLLSPVRGVHSSSCHAEDNKYVVCWLLGFKNENFWLVLRKSKVRFLARILFFFL